MDYLLLALLLAGVAYMIGMANYGAPTPLDGVRRIVHGADMSTDRRRSDDVRAEASDTVDMSERGAEVLTVSREHVRNWGPSPELAHLAGADDDEQPAMPASADAAARREWVREQLRAGRAPGWINRTGARRFGVDEKTIRRDRAHVDAARRT